MTIGPPATSAGYSSSGMRAADHEVQGELPWGSGQRGSEGVPDRERIGRTVDADAPRQVGTERMEAELQGRDDPEVGAGPSHRPEQVWMIGLARAHVRAARPSRARRPSGCRGSGRIVSGAGRRHRRAPGRRRRCARRFRWGTQDRVPGPRGRVRRDAPRHSRVRCGSFGSTETPRIRDRSMTMPSSQVEKPVMLWPPPRTAILRSASRAYRTAAATSSTLSGRTTSLGRRS